ncbi:hypothetical protein [Tolumonas lignilytica]|uniref:hypothetical protein n=1 Tax=Tolumonas lignilytica TaxID=1283284 RepID=UPI000464613D|nr:hypothetical protein [Tolumonas lignilytica]
MSLETYLLLHQAKTVATDSRGSSHGIGRDEILHAGAVAALKYPIGHHLFLAENGDEKSLLALIQFANEHLPELTEEVVAVAMGKPTTEQWNRLVRAHPRYERERKRADKIKSQAKFVLRKGDEGEAERLTKIAEKVKSDAVAHCRKDILSTGSCPSCRGDGIAVRRKTTCVTCRGTGKIIPDDASIKRIHGDEVYAKFRKVVESMLFDKSDWVRMYYRQINCEKCE